MRFLKGTLAGPDRFRLGAFYLHDEENGGMTMTQEQYYQAHFDAMTAINEYISGVLLLSELKARLAAIPSSTETGLVDPATGLRF